jgi:hypothetical protein
MAWYRRRYTIDVQGNSYSIDGESEIRRLPKETERTLKALVKEHGVNPTLAAVARAQKQIKGPTLATER